MWLWLVNYRSSGGLHFLPYLQPGSVSLEGPSLLAPEGRYAWSYCLPDIHEQVHFNSETYFLEVPSASALLLVQSLVRICVSVHCACKAFLLVSTTFLSLLYALRTIFRELKSFTKFSSNELFCWEESLPSFLLLPFCLQELLRI